MDDEIKIHAHLEDYGTGTTRILTDPIPGIMATARETQKAVLRTDSGLVQLVRCPVCLYMVGENLDVIWKRQPLDVMDSGEIERCRFCSSAP
jgi:hypothetical protein